MADPNAWLDDDNPHEVQQQPAIPITAIRRITPTTEAGGPTEEIDVWYQAASGAQYRISSNWDLALNMQTSGSPSGTKKEREQLSQLISMLNAEEKLVIASGSIRLWREIQIWMAVEGAFEGYAWSYDQIINEDNLKTMLMDRPGSQLAPYRYHKDESTVPKNYVGMICISGKWFHEC